MGLTSDRQSRFTSHKQSITCNLNRLSIHQFYLLVKAKETVVWGCILLYIIHIYSCFDHNLQPHPVFELTALVNIFKMVDSNYFQFWSKLDNQDVKLLSKQK